MAVALAVVCLGPSAGCISLEKRDVEAARERLDECVAEHGREHPDCQEAELSLRGAQERYDEKARQAWSCDPTQDLCPTPR